LPLRRVLELLELLDAQYSIKPEPTDPNLQTTNGQLRLMRFTLPHSPTEFLNMLHDLSSSSDAEYIKQTIAKIQDLLQIFQTTIFQTTAGDLGSFSPLPDENEFLKNINSVVLQELLRPLLKILSFDKQHKFFKSIKNEKTGKVNRNSLSILIFACLILQMLRYIVKFLNPSKENLDSETELLQLKIVDYNKKIQELSKTKINRPLLFIGIACLISVAGILIGVTLAALKIVRPAAWLFGFSVLLCCFAGFCLRMAFSQDTTLEEQRYREVERAIEEYSHRGVRAIREKEDKLDQLSQKFLEEFFEIIVPKKDIAIEIAESNDNGKEEEELLLEKREEHNYSTFKS
jgi:hypothetical protein